MTVYTHLTLMLLYPDILCNLTLERIRHKLPTQVGSFTETRVSPTFFFSPFGTFANPRYLMIQDVSYKCSTASTIAMK